MKRVVSVFLATLLLVSLFAVSAAAESDVTITVASVSGKKGDIVEVPVSISANSYLVNADMHVTFDATKVRLVEYYADPDGEEGDKICYSVENTVLDGSWMYLGNEKTTGDFLFVGATGKINGLTTGGELFRLAFEILVDEATTVAIDFTADPIMGNDGSGAPDATGYPADYEIDYTVAAGSITVGPTMLVGDVTGDGQVNMLDVLMLYNGTGGKIVLTDAQRAAGDMTGDGQVNMLDVLQLYNRVGGKQLL